MSNQSEVSVKSAAYPPQFSSKEIESVLASNTSGSKSNNAFVDQQAWSIAISPVKQMGMNLFMIWMMGSGAGIIAILLVGFAFMQVVRLALAVNSAFRSCGDHNVLMQKAAYLAACAGLLLYVGNHAISMGLLPIHDADWLDHLPVTYVPKTSFLVSSK